jgi:hypothetical protein
MDAHNCEGAFVSRIEVGTPLLAGEFADAIRSSNRENKPCSRGANIDDGGGRSRCGKRGYEVFG